MADVLVYASTHGHTAKVAARIADGLRAEGVDEVDVRDVPADAGTLDPGAYDAVVAGGSLHVGHHQGELLDWVKSHRAALADRPSAFFSVSLTAADDSDEAREATQRCIDDFLAETDAVERFGREFAALVAQTTGR